MKALAKEPKQGLPPKPGHETDKNWKAYFKRTIVLVFLISLAVHLLLLIGFGGMTLFKGRMTKLPFTAQQIAADKIIEAVAPPTDDLTSPEEKTSDPFQTEQAAPSSSEDSAPPLEMVTAPGGASWAPALARDVKASPTGAFGGTGTGPGTGTGKEVGKGGVGSGVKLFGVEVKAKKLGVIVSINKGAQSSGRLPGIFDEIFRLFPDSPVFLTNGGGMRDWEVVEIEYNKKIEENNKKKKAGEPYDKFMGKEIKKPEVGRFNSGAALEWVVVRGFKPDPEYVGLREKHPELFEDLRRRPNVWFISSNKEADGAYLAFSDLLKKGVEAIYWYNQFDRPIEGKAADDLARKIGETKIEILVQNQGGKVTGRDWLDKVGAKFVK